MKAEKAYILDKIKELRSIFKNASFKYQFKDSSDTHFIQVTPKSVFVSDDFIEKDILVIDEYESLGFDNSICFISDDSLTELENPEVFTVPPFNTEVLTSIVDTSLNFNGLTEEDIAVEREILLVA